MFILYLPDILNRLVKVNEMATILLFIHELFATFYVANFINRTPVLQSTLYVLLLVHVIKNCN